MSVTALDHFRGCLAGGAMGDALGYPVEFWPGTRIQDTFGPGGLTHYLPDRQTGLALISDDTQMTLFTACGLLRGWTHRRAGAGEPWEVWVYQAYLDWLATQTGRLSAAPRVSWLLELPELHQCRAPGNTCLSALGSGRMGTVDSPLNHSKGCGGVMRVAPAALFAPELSPQEGDWLGGRLAAITHSHPLGYLPAAALVHLLRRVVWEGASLAESAADCADALSREFAGTPHLDELLDLLALARDLSQNRCTDLENIAALGQGWTGEEALAISLYCALRYPENFSQALTAAVSHRGDSDSTGAITGNLVGAALGYDRIPRLWKENLELLDATLTLAEDLYRTTRPDFTPDSAWQRRYGA